MAIDEVIEIYLSEHGICYYPTGERLAAVSGEYYLIKKEVMDDIMKPEPEESPFVGIEITDEYMEEQGIPEKLPFEGDNYYLERSTEVYPQKILLLRYLSPEFDWEINVEEEDKNG